MKKCILIFEMLSGLMLNSVEQILRKQFSKLNSKSVCLLNGNKTWTQVKTQLDNEHLNDRNNEKKQK